SCTDRVQRHANAKSVAEREMPHPERNAVFSASEFTRLSQKKWRSIPSFLEGHFPRTTIGAGPLRKSAFPRRPNRPLGTGASKTAHVELSAFLSCSARTIHPLTS